MTRLAFDMSSYLKTALRAGKDLKDGQLVSFEGKEVLVNSAAYGYENVMNMMLKTLKETGLNPIDCVLVFEGMNSKAKRMLIDLGYKGKRDKQPPEFYEQFNTLKLQIDQLWRDLGAIAISQDGVEADDVLAYLACETEEELIIATRDNDMGACIGTNKHGASIHMYNDGIMDMPKMDGAAFVHPCKYITLYKALVGDTSDSITGVNNFGPARFQKFLEQYGYDGADELISLLEQGKLDALHEMASERHPAGKQKDKPVHPLVAQIVEFEQDAVKSYKLARMYPEWVTFHRPTVKNHLTFRPGKHAPCPDYPDARIEHWYGYSYLITADNYSDALETVQMMTACTPDWDFDIETSAPPESDDWLAAQGDPDGVDQLGHELTGFSLTFGENKQHTIYVSVDHRDTNNVTRKQARELLEIAFDTGKPVVIHNNFFELAVIGQTTDEDGTKWSDLWAKRYPEYRGFIPNSLDTKMESSYVNENIKNGLKLRSKMHLGYDQQTYEETTCKDGHPDALPAGGKLKQVLQSAYKCAGCASIGFAPSGLNDRCTFCDGVEGGMLPTREETKAWNLAHPVDHGEQVPVLVRRQYKMNELTAQEVFSYGCDDTICTGALHRFYKLVMQLEHQYQTYLKVEIDASYQHAKNFLDGVHFSLEKMRELEADDKVTYDAAWTTVRGYLMAHGWAGTVPPTYTAAITAPEIKEAYRIVVLGAGKGGEIEIEMELGGNDDEEDKAAEPGEVEGEEEGTKDAFLASKVRTPSKLCVLARELGHTVFAGMVERCLEGQGEKFTSWVREHFSGEPLFAISNKQMQKLLYTVMALPIRVRNKPTAIMKKAGQPGNPKGDALALAYAMRDGTPQQVEVLKALQLMQMVLTRRRFYYSKYPNAVHWKTGLIHSTHNQCQANTRRASESKVNKQQLPKNPKIEGHASRYRETIVPHHPDAVIVSLDEDSQELRIIADYSKDENMVSAFVGENKKSLHSLTGHAVGLKKKQIPLELTYAEFDKAAKDKSHPLYNKCSELRALGKKINFTTEFGAMAEKLAMTLLVDIDEAQDYIDAKEAQFPGVRVWKDATIAESKQYGIVRTMEGAVRHLAFAYMGDDYWLKSKAERQAVNFKVQSSAAEMVKKAEGRVFRLGLTYKYDAVCLGPIHDELVFSVMKRDLVEFLKEAHWCMVQPYGGMVIPIMSSISFGPNFGIQAEIGTEPTEEAVKKGWEEIEKMLAKRKAAA